MFKIYYIDDEPQILEVFKIILSQLDCEVTTFEDPLHAIEVIKTNPPNFLFVDYRLPGLTGLDVIHRLNNFIIPKALLTGELDLEHDPEIKSKFDIIFTKPLDLNLIKSYIEKLINLKKT